MKEGDKVLDMFGRKGTVKKVLRDDWYAVRIGEGTIHYHRSEIRPNTWAHRVLNLFDFVKWGV